MSTIKISQECRERLKEISEKGESVDTVLNRLFEQTEKPNIDKGTSAKSKTNIYLKDGTLERLKEYKYSNSESHSDTIMRLIEQNLHR